MKISILIISTLLLVGYLFLNTETENLKKANIILNSETKIYPTNKYQSKDNFSTSNKNILFEVEGTMEATPVVWGGNLL